MAERRTRRSAKPSAAIAIALMSAACVAPPLPSESTTVELELAAGESSTIEFQALVTSEVDGFIQITMLPTRQTLEAQRIEATLRSEIDGVQLDGWPTEFDDAPVESGVTHTVEFEVELRNEGAETQNIELRIEVQVNSTSVPQPFPDEVSITLTQR